MTKQLKKVAIVIPYYKADISSEEEISIMHLNKFLGQFDKFLVLPESLTKVSFKIHKSRIVHFPDEYFGSIKKYCEMLNMKKFYENFLNYEYILIHQLDALVFSDQLIAWCNKGYDYVGSPLFNSKIGLLTRPKNSSISGCNGGFSLRRVRRFIKIIDITLKESERFSNDFKIRKLWFYQAVLTGKSRSKWLKAPAYCYPFNEDGFWSYEAVKYYPEFKIAPFKEALEFSFERYPRKCFKLNNYKLPFGCHAWKRYAEQFWSRFLLT